MIISKMSNSSLSRQLSPEHQLPNLDSKQLKPLSTVVSSARVAFSQQLPKGLRRVLSGYVAIVSWRLQPITATIEQEIKSHRQLI